jgi:hypothetical protein
MRYKYDWTKSHFYHNFLINFILIKLLVSDENHEYGYIPVDQKCQRKYS